jgi:hypothetical protein
MNNALDYISKNGGVVRSLTFGLDADLIKDSRQPVSESDLIRAMDLVADRLLKLSQSDLGIDREPLSCLAALDLPVYQTTLSAFLETVGDYFDSKGRNFGSSAGPQMSQYEDAASGPVARVDDRIKASCYAIKIYSLASAKLNHPTPSDQIDDESPFGHMLAFYNHYTGMQALIDKADSVKAFLTNTYSEGQLSSYCPSSYTSIEPPSPAPSQAQ